MQNQFSRSELLIGKEGIEKLHKSRVAIFGIGGVGGYTVDALVRSGVEQIDLIDDDKVCLTNLNRQLIATRKTIGKDKVDIIFDRFERFDNKNAAIKEGSGIGLSIVKKLVDALGGKIEIKSEVDKGTTVRLIFKKSNSQNNLEQIYDMQHLEEKVNLEMSDIS